MRTAQSDWDFFKASANPLTSPREIKQALRSGPGLPSIYAEVKRHGTLFGIPVLSVGRNIFVPRQRVIDVVEGRNSQTGE